MPFVFRQCDLPKLDLQVDRGTDFKAWKAQWDAYISLSGLADQSQSKQVQALTLCFSRETVTIVDNLGLSVADRGDAGKIVNAIQSYVAGQINERRNFRSHTQQSFDDFLVSLRELAKTCQFCSDACCQKNIRDQVIEGLLDGDTVENLLREDLTLVTTISKCRAQEAAKQQRTEMAGDTSTRGINAVRRQPQPVRQSTQPVRQLPTSGRPTTQFGRMCIGCGYDLHPGGRQQCPAFNRICHLCKKVGHVARVCKGGRAPPAKFNSHPAHAAMAVHVESPLEEEVLPNVNASKVSDLPAFEPAPTVHVELLSLNGQASVQVLPDSGADISVAGRALLSHLQEHPDKLLPSNVTPRAVNGSLMRPIGRLPVTITLGTAVYAEDFHIYTDVSTTLLSWRAARGLRILPECYPLPVELPGSPLVATIQPPPGGGIMEEFPSVFDGTVKVMEGEFYSG